MDRRALLTGAAALLAAPQIVSAQTASDGGFQLAPELQPQMVRVRQQYAPGQIFVLPRSHFLYHITEPGLARRYGVGVGKAGLDFQGEAVIQVKKEWPTWRPTDEMIERSPEAYGKFKDSDYVQPGGPSNPLGARALYLFKNGRDTYYRIHGTTEPQSIGRSVSNGCIRMLNAHVKELYEQVPVGTKVTVF
ncbi:L,D-transpeptidase family protein [Aquicoccus sp. SCR17]|nr:L,D-transpeptidase family protein [Carideicomes alvinocaridis]